MVKQATPTTQAIPMHLSFTVPGEAVPKGSAKGFVPKGWTRPVITGDNPRTKGWQAMVSAAALDAQYVRGTWSELSVQPIRLAVTCVFVRPASVSERKRPMMTVKPDLDKLLRAIKDALTKILWRDDAQVVAMRVAKRYASAGEPAHTDVTVDEILPPIPELVHTPQSKPDTPAALLPLMEDIRG